MMVSRGAAPRAGVETCVDDCGKEGLKSRK